MREFVKSVNCPCCSSLITITHLMQLSLIKLKASKFGMHAMGSKLDIYTSGDNTVECHNTVGTTWLLEIARGYPHTNDVKSKNFSALLYKGNI